MRFDIMTLFPQLVDTVLSESIIGRARRGGAIEVLCHNIRDYSEDKHRNVDDTPYGGGKGMLMSCPPIYNCYRKIESTFANGERTRVIYMSPKGKVMTQGDVERLSGYDRIVVLCGHYEGVDQRIIDRIVDEEISVGDYVLTGGEIPACILVDAVARLSDGVLSAEECHTEESFSSGLLEYPQYTRPFSFMGDEVPAVLLSGNHAQIDRWRLEKAMEITAERRPMMLEEYLRTHAEVKTGRKHREGSAEKAERQKQD